ncbi:helix-turn-helix transcriptional regulator [Oceanobacter sp. 4_MG-2023]|uniref:S24 family peptidase n=1 Tax=Oceanobacter sp. 4_MG-2023 TaxID=3062623 RepID=UPI0027356364|nr:helix-turn-helix transcriptional regulator [Oceanobacter sp. 4_MG-2023]MDP2548874.1 helix-turn-helix transcriptional regulator [Oceanobacter sp. 4_MG-2023]
MKDSFSERIQILIDKFGRQKLSDASGISTTQLHRLRNADRDTSRTNLIALCQATGVNLLWLATGDGAMYPEGSTITDTPVRISEPSNRYSVPSEYALIPVLDIQAAAGNGSVVDSESIADVYAYKRDWLRNELGANAADLRIIRVSGDSMSPKLNSGELVFVDVREGHYSGDGVYILRMGDSLLVKNVQRLPGQILRIRSENTAYESFDIRLDESSNDEVAIIGRVVWAVSGRRV